jgi:AraC-like DNA-binding protein
MPNESKILLKQLNPFLDLNFSNISIDNDGYHATTAFPVNIMIFVIRESAKGHDYYENIIENQRLPLLMNHVYFIPCGLKIRFEENEGRSAISLHFNLTYVQGIDIFSGSKHCVMRHAPELVARFRAIMDEKDNLKAICALKMEVMQFCLSCWPKNLNLLTPVVQKYEPIFRYIREHGDARLSVGDLADLTKQRQNVFSRNFSRDIGKSPKEFLKDDLLKKITVNLLSPQTNVKQTADKLRFSSEFYMSRFFKKHTGLSPSEYQRKFRH